MQQILKKPEQALDYENPEMVQRYAQRNDVSLEAAQALFKECKEFLVRCSTAKKRISPTKEVDEMWHFFIIHTIDYAAFCDQFFGRFIHHVPTDEAAHADDCWGSCGSDCGQGGCISCSTAGLAPLAKP